MKLPRCARLAGSFKILDSTLSQFAAETAAYGGGGGSVAGIFEEFQVLRILVPFEQNNRAAMQGTAGGARMM